MTWTTPTNVSTGTASSSKFNSETVDNLQHLYDEILVKEVGCRVVAGTQSLTTATTTAITYATERFDDDTMHSTSTSTSRITFTTAGFYIVGAGLRFASNSTGYRQGNIRLNGTTVIAATDTPAVSGNQTFLNISTGWRFSASDYIEVEAYQNSGGNLNFEAGTGHTEFYAYRIGA